MYMNGTHRNTCMIHAGYMQDTWDTYRIGKYTKTYRKPHVTRTGRGGGRGQRPPVGRSGPRGSEGGCAAAAHWLRWSVRQHE